MIATAQRTCLVPRLCKCMCDMDSDPMRAKGGGRLALSLSPGSFVSFKTFAVRGFVGDSRMYWSEFDREIFSRHQGSGLRRSTSETTEPGLVPPLLIIPINAQRSTCGPWDSWAGDSSTSLKTPFLSGTSLDIRSLEDED